MNTKDRTQHPPQAGRSKWVLIGFLMVAAYFLWTEHQAHLMSVLPYLLLLACPLMHLFHHHGHGRPHGHHQDSKESESNRASHPAGGES
jgi:hypothetical protein